MPFLADLVTLADPTSPHSFLAYLHDRGRLYRFYLHERWHALRREFDDYYRWAAERLASCRFGARVEEVRPRPGGGWTVVLASGEEHGARAVVLGVGSVPAVPGCAHALLGERGPAQRRLRARRASVLRAPARDGHRVGPERGGGRRRPARPRAGGARSPGSRAARASCRWSTPSSASSTSRRSTRRTSTGCAAERRDALRAGQDLLYKGISAATSERIYDALYRRSIGGAEPDVAYAARCELRELGRTASGALRLVLHHLDEDAAFTHETDVLVLGTGYRAAQPPGARRWPSSRRSTSAGGP